MNDELSTDLVRRVLADDGWGDVDPAAFHHAAVEGIAWALLDQTCDLADRGASEGAYREARATAERLLAADVAAARADERERLTTAIAAMPPEARRVEVEALLCRDFPPGSGGAA